VKGRVGTANKWKVAIASGEDIMDFMVLRLFEAYFISSKKLDGSNEYLEV